MILSKLNEMEISLEVQRTERTSSRKTFRWEYDHFITLTMQCLRKGTWRKITLLESVLTLDDQLSFQTSSFRMTRRHWDLIDIRGKNASDQGTRINGFKWYLFSVLYRSWPLLSSSKWEGKGRIPSILSSRRCLWYMRIYILNQESLYSGTKDNIYICL